MQDERPHHILARLHALNLQIHAVECVEEVQFVAQHVAIQVGVVLVVGVLLGIQGDTKFLRQEHVARSGILARDGVHLVADDVVLGILDFGEEMQGVIQELGGGGFLPLRLMVEDGALGGKFQVDAHQRQIHLTALHALIHALVHLIQAIVQIAVNELVVQLASHLRTSKDGGTHFQMSQFLDPVLRTHLDGEFQTRLHHAVQLCTEAPVGFGFEGEGQEGCRQVTATHRHIGIFALDFDALGERLNTHAGAEVEVEMRLGTREGFRHDMGIEDGETGGEGYLGEPADQRPNARQVGETGIVVELAVQQNGEARGELFLQFCLDIEVRPRYVINCRGRHAEPDVGVEAEGEFAIEVDLPLQTSAEVEQRDVVIVAFDALGLFHAGNTTADGCALGVHHILHLFHGDELPEHVAEAFHIVAINGDEAHLLLHFHHFGYVGGRLVILIHIALQVGTYQHIAHPRTQAGRHGVVEGQVHVKTSDVVLQHPLVPHEADFGGELDFGLYEAHRVDGREHDAVGTVLSHNLLRHVLVVFYA